MVDSCLFLLLHSCSAALQLGVLEEARIMGLGSKLTSCASINQVLTRAKMLSCCNSRILLLDGLGGKEIRKMQNISILLLLFLKTEPGSRHSCHKAKLLVNLECRQLQGIKSLKLSVIKVSVE